MSINPIGTRIVPAMPAIDPPGKSGGAQGSGADFASLIAKSLERVNASQSQAEGLAHQYQLGQNEVSLEDAMISMQKATIGFQATVQVRNKLVAAYNDIMNMPL